MPEKRSDIIFLRRAYAVTVVLLFLYFQFWQVNFYLAQSIKDGVYLFVPPVLIAGVLYFRRLRDGIEVKLVAAYLIWVVITRVLNGDRVLERQYVFLLDLALALPFLSLGLVLDDAGRRRVLNWLSAILGVCFSALGLIGVYSFVTGRNLVNPITGGMLASVSRLPGRGELAFLDTNPNIVAFWYMIALTLMLWCAASDKRLWLRVLAALAALLDIAVISLTQCRGVFLSVAVGLGLLAALLLRRRCERQKAALTAALAILVFLAAAAASYTAMDRLGALIWHEPTPVAAEESAAMQAHLTPRAEPQMLRAVADQREAEPVQLNSVFEKLDGISTGRLKIWKAAFQALRENPRILLFGQDGASVIDETNRFLVQMQHYAESHFHNYLLHTLMLTGLPGLLLVLLFSVLLALCCLRMLLTPAAALPDQILCISALGAMLYGQLEAGFFTFTDSRTLFFYLLAGFCLSAAAAKA